MALTTSSFLGYRGSRPEVLRSSSRKRHQRSQCMCTSLTTTLSLFGSYHRWRSPANPTLHGRHKLVSSATELPDSSIREEQSTVLYRRRPRATDMVVDSQPHTVRPGFRSSAVQHMYSTGANLSWEGGLSSRVSHDSHPSLHLFFESRLQ